MRLYAALTFATFSLLVQSPRAQIDALIDKLKVDIDAILTPPTSTGTMVTSNLQAAINKAAPGSTLLVAFAETAPVTIAKSLILEGQPGAALLGGVWVTGPGTVNVTLSNLKLRNNDHSNQVVDISNLAKVTLSKVDCQGDLTVGQKRCVIANGGAFAMQDSWCSNIFWDGEDSQCVVSWDSPGPILLERNHLSAASENVLIGGSDPSSPTRVPSDVVLRGNTLTKDLRWRSMNVNVKNLFELKMGHRVTVEDNTMDYNWSGAQQGWAVLFTPRNQYGGAAYVSIDDVLFQRNLIRHSAAAMQLSGSDDGDGHPGVSSGPLQRVKILNNRFEDIDPKAWAGASEPSSHMIAISRGPIDVTFDGNTFLGQNIGSTLYFSDPPKSTNFVFTNNTVPKSYYGIFGADAAVGAAWAQWVASGLLSGNIEQ